MARYYDVKCLKCASCYFFGVGNFPDGTPYEACRHYGYILHPENGVVDEDCAGFRTEQQYEIEQMMKQRRRK